MIKVKSNNRLLRCRVNARETVTSEHQSKLKARAAFTFARGIFFYSADSLLVTGVVLGVLKMLQRKMSHRQPDRLRTTMDCSKQNPVAGRSYVRGQI